jgi:DNA segregation ATPase FtsK/SpoIIIE, S-DNA-T family
VYIRQHTATSRRGPSAVTVSSLRLAIVDPKILTFTGINGCPFLAQPVITEVKAAIALLKSAVSEMEKRYQALAADG